MSTFSYLVALSIANGVVIVGTINNLTAAQAGAHSVRTRSRKRLAQNPSMDLANALGLHNLKLSNISDIDTVL